MNDGEQDLKAKLNGETARIRWHELERHFARAALITVDPGEDLIAVAAAIAANDTTSVDRWLRDDRIRRTLPEEAARWAQGDSELWGVVVAPWVLVQETTN